MKISVITPSYNQGPYIERTIQSVLEQDADTEYIIIDGKSEDQTVEILEKYSSKLNRIIIEQDSGQADAINKGLRLASGDIVCWINSDDKFLPGTFLKVTESFTDQPVMWLTGDCEVIDEKDSEIGYYNTELPDNYFHWLNLLVRGFSCSIIQPSTFWRREVVDQLGYLDDRLHYSFDHEFFLRILKKYKDPLVLAGPLSQFRLHSTSKTQSNEKAFIRENREIGMKYAKMESWPKQLYLNMVHFREKYLRD